MFDALGVALQRDTGDVFLNKAMRGGLADKRKVAAGGPRRLAWRLVGEQIVAEPDRFEMDVLLAMRGEPAACPCEGGGWAARVSRSGFSARSWGRMNSGASGTTGECPGATMDAPGMAIIARDPAQPEQALGVRPAVAVAQALLMRQERRTSHEEHRERRHADI